MGYGEQFPYLLKNILERAVKDMNAKLEEEARKLSEEKGLPFEYVKQMLEFAEWAADNSIDFPEPLKPHPIPEKTVMF